jgi:membrane protein required for beta-lactamase induction
MTLISALLGIAADRLLPHLHAYRHYQPFLAYVDWVRERLVGPAWDHLGGLLLLLLPWWVAVALLQNWSSEWLFGLVGLLFHVAVLLYCLGPRDLAGDAESYREACAAGDSGLQKTAAAWLLGDAEVPEDSTQCAQAVGSAVLVEASDRLFAVLFWFALLGPVGAVMYRSVALLDQRRRERGEFGDSVSWLNALLIWLPTRLAALGYALSGDFDTAVEGWRSAHQGRPQGSEGSLQVLEMTGAGALGGASAGQDAVRRVGAAMRLVWRTLGMWLVLIALLTLAGWAS